MAFLADGLNGQEAWSGRPSARWSAHPTHRWCTAHTSAHATTVARSRLNAGSPGRPRRAGNSDTGLVAHTPAHDCADSATPCRRRTRRRFPALRPQIPNRWRAHLRSAMRGTNLAALLPTRYSFVRHRSPPRNRPNTRRQPMVQTVQKNIRVTPKQWERIEIVAGELEFPPLAARRACLRSALPSRMALHRGRNSPSAFRDVHRTGHCARHGGSRARPGD